MYRKKRFCLQGGVERGRGTGKERYTVQALLNGYPRGRIVTA